MTVMKEVIKRVARAKELGLLRRVRLSDIAIQDGCNADALGSGAGIISEILTNGMIRVLIDGKDVPLTYVPEYWDAE